MGTSLVLKTEPDREKSGRREEPVGKKSLLADGRPVPDHSTVTQLSLLVGGKADTLRTDSLDVVVQMKHSEINSSFIMV
ncbi:hypothetical protein PO909_015528 [Leuciscus waleckii]